MAQQKLCSHFRNSSYELRFTRIPRTSFANEIGRIFSQCWRPPRREERLLPPVSYQGPSTFINPSATRSVRLITTVFVFPAAKTGATPRPAPTPTPAPIGCHPVPATSHDGDYISRRSKVRTSAAGSDAERFPC